LADPPTFHSRAIIEGKKSSDGIEIPQPKGFHHCDNAMLREVQTTVR